MPGCEPGSAPAPAPVMAPGTQKAAVATRVAGRRLRFGGVSGERTFLSRLTGSFSSPAAGNPTIAIVEAAYRHHGLDVRYINCEVTPEQLGDAVRGARAMAWLGFNLSTPHKVTVIPHLDSLAESAAICAAPHAAPATAIARGEREVAAAT